MDIMNFANGNFFVHMSDTEPDYNSCVEDMFSYMNSSSCGTYCEVFDSPKGSLIFARNLYGYPVSYEFNTFTEALEAASMLDDDTVSFIAKLSNMYYIVVYTYELGSPPPILGEFSSPITSHPNFLRHISEHGVIILGPTAAQTIHDRLSVS